jgi:hypothetical protein
MARTRKRSEHYVDNKKFLEAMTEFKDRCDKAKKRGRKTPPVTEYIGECFLKIANHLSYRPNFINYTFRVRSLLPREFPCQCRVGQLLSY